MSPDAHCWLRTPIVGILKPEVEHQGDGRQPVDTPAAAPPKAPEALCGLGHVLRS